MYVNVFIPDLFGRKSFMLIMLFYVDMDLKKIAFFLIGMFHLKISLSYIYISEFEEIKHNLLASTIISAYDGTTLIVTCIAIKRKCSLNIIF